MAPKKMRQAHADLGVILEAIFGSYVAGPRLGAILETKGSHWQPF